MIYVFLIVNVKSGEGSGQELLRLGFNYLSLRTEHKIPGSLSQCQEDGHSVKLIIDSIQAPPGVLPNLGHNYRLFELLARVTRTKRTNPNTCRIMVAGGDGTLMWCIQCLRHHNIDLESLSLGIVPLGTGNDFARAVGCLGFSSSCRRLPVVKKNLTSSSTNPFKKNKDETYIEMMTRLLHSWLELEPELIDLWNVKISVKPGSGAFHKIDSQTRKKKKIKRTPKYERSLSQSTIATPVLKSGSNPKPSTPDVTELNMTMSNYFSLGIESRIGIGFDRNRTKSLALNKMAYVFEAFKKLVFHRTYCISSLIQSVDVKNKSGADWSTLCVTRRNKDNSHIPLLSPCVSLIFLNIPSFAGGLDVWRSAQGKLGLVKPTNLIDDNDSWADLVKSSCSGDQSIGDGKLDLIAFKSLLELSLSNFQRYIPNPPSSGWRIAQAGQMIRVKFNNGDNTKRQDPPRVYFQVDGEFFIATDLLDILIEHDHKIHVLANPTGKSLI